MTTEQRPLLDELIASWRDWMERRDTLSVRDVDELESHLRDRIDALGAAGLTDDEAFLIAVKRLGSMDELSREYAAEHSGRLWKQLVLTETAGIDGVDAPAGMLPFARRANGLPVALALGVGAGIAVKATEVLTGDPELVLRNISVLVLPFLAGWFAWRRRPPLTTLVGIAAVFAVVALALNLYPFVGGSSNVTVATQNSATAVLATIGAIVALWFVTGVVDAGGVWRSDRTRMDFLRFSGEWLVYYVLIALVGGALSGLTVAVFASIGIDVMPFVGEWVLPCGAAGAVLVSAWLVGAKQRVIENIAPVLTKVFTPLFTLMMLALIIAAVMQWNLVDGSRDLLIAFDLVLVVAVALLVYSISARDPGLPPGWFDRLQVLMLTAALVVDLVVLVAMVVRTGEFGWSANKTASLGLNLILLASLAWAAWLHLGFVQRRVPFGVVERWQTGYLPVYVGWAAIIVFAFPPLFGFV
ncbi:permease prefix domain 1-containing protein [Agromyces sp. NPDC056965]|uniref:permease prefix domain 1-containing protein n=1 Tax=Agromyces sp. NPDC056965 TaxID=3345983 RepID=UPI00363B26E6